MKFMWIAVALALAACGGKAPSNEDYLAEVAEAQAEMDSLKSWMTGSFSSAAQSAADSDYFHITLHMNPVPWETEKGFWLYVEQAAASNPEKPYRQRMYHVHDEMTHIQSDIYLLPVDSLVVGMRGDESYWKEINPDSVKIKDGCGVTLTSDMPRGFKGSTQGKGCESKLFGANYATSEVTIVPDTITSWDRGYDEADEQIWGAEKGAYIFIRD